jgi:hypothetical protein
MDVTLDQKAKMKSFMMPTFENYACKSDRIRQPKTCYEDTITTVKEIVMIVKMSPPCSSLARGTLLVGLKV